MRVLWRDRATRALGSTAAWMGVGCANPNAPSAAHTGSLTPSACHALVSISGAGGMATAGAALDGCFALCFLPLVDGNAVEMGAASVLGATCTIGALSTCLLFFFACFGWGVAALSTVACGTGWTASGLSAAFLRFLRFGSRASCPSCDALDGCKIQLKLILLELGD